MNTIDIFVVLVVAVFVTIFCRQGFVAVLKSFVSFFIGAIFAMIFLNTAMGIIFNLGWRENVFTPLVLFPFLIIVFWGILASIAATIPIYWQGRISSILSVPVSIIYGLCVCVVLNLVVPQLVSLKAIDLSSNSIFSLSLRKISVYNYYRGKFLTVIGQELAKAIIVPRQNNEAVFLKFQNNSSSISATSAAQMLELTNKSRQAKELTPLKEDKTLDALALSYAGEILETKRFSHVDSSGKTPDERAKDLSLKYNYMGENLVIASTIESAHAGLMASEEHRASIESPIFRNIGIAVLDLGGNGKLIVEEFAN